MYDDIRHPGAVDTKSVLLMDGPFAYALAEIFGIVDTAGNPVDQLEATLDPEWSQWHYDADRDIYRLHLHVGNGEFVDATLFAELCPRDNDQWWLHFEPEPYVSVPVGRVFVTDPDQRVHYADEPYREFDMTSSLTLDGYAKLINRELYAASQRIGIA